MSKESQLAFGESTHIRGVNIGNALDAPNPGEWGVFIHPEYFEIIKDAGFNTVRLPVRFSAHTSIETPYTIAPDFLNEVDQAISTGLNNDLTIILDMHHYDEIMTDPDGQEQRFLAIWDQLSKHYQFKPDNLYFEILNEPVKNLDSQKWNKLAAKAIKQIRNSNPQRKIIVSGVGYGNALSLENLILPGDRNLIATFHLYDPFPFTHQGADWVEGADSWRGMTWDGSASEKKLIIEQMDFAAKWSAKKKIPVIIGEFGAIRQADRPSRLRWTSFIAREAEKHNIGWIHWQFCSDFPVYSCEDNHWDRDLLGALIPENVGQ